MIAIDGVPLLAMVDVIVLAAFAVFAWRQGSAALPRATLVFVALAALLVVSTAGGFVASRYLVLRGQQVEAASMLFGIYFYLKFAAGIAAGAILTRSRRARS
jgi:hypothetical protein